MVTHYTNRFDDRGQPHGVYVDSGDVAGPLPEGWDDTNWKWEPPYDPFGEWVYYPDKKPGVLWDRTKAIRQEAVDAGVVVLIAGRGHRLKLDAQSVSIMWSRFHRMSLTADSTTQWTTKDNVTITLSQSELSLALLVIDHTLNAINEWSQNIRERLDNTANHNFIALKQIEEHIELGFSLH